MKSVLTLALVLIFSAAVSGTTHGQISGDITLNLPMPTGDFADIAKPGLGVGGDLFFGLPMIPIKLGGRIAYNNFSEEDDFNGGSTSIIEILPSVRYSLGLPMEILSVFAQFGLGMYNWKNDANDETDFGVSAGAGLSGNITPTLSLVAMPLYHIIMTDDDNLTYLSLNIGLKF